MKEILNDSQVLTGAQATETALKRAAGPVVLHIATHGFFLPNRPEESASDDGASRGPEAPRGENPLLRSGLALAGANQRDGGDGEDGVFTALEAAGLDLWGSKVVVLSACETGLGAINNGDGVYGLRRALMLAGAETQVTSLWKVDDAATRDLMRGYYRRLKTGKGRTEALRDVQKAMLQRSGRSHPYYWAAFIPIGDWRNLDGRQ
ncbi:MAG TPA: CHAT domain-containing protein [Burkholderiales bacterium]|nr:CHAT domain-containing protein [Burkholderiales bacterium]